MLRSPPRFPWCNPSPALQILIWMQSLLPSESQRSPRGASARKYISLILIWRSSFMSRTILRSRPISFSQLPYPAFYIQASGLDLNGEQYHGVFVHLEHDINSGDRELRLLYLKPDGATMGFPIHIDSSDLAQSMQRTIDEATQNSSNPNISIVISSESSALNCLSDLLRRTLQIILYICAENAEIAPNSEQAFITRRTSTIKDRYAEIRKWDVGFRIGAAIRKYNRRYSPDDPDRTAGTHASPRPHMRRGHWHRYWVGSRSDPDTRKLILKWTPPTIVGTQQENAPIVYHIKNLEDSNEKS